VEVADLSQLIPRDFMKIGCGSLEMISESSFRPIIRELSRRELTDYDEDLELDIDPMNDLQEPTKLSPISDETPVFGVDTSNIELGETAKGILCAIRGTIVWRENREYQYVRHGPFIFHVTEMNKQDLYNTLHQVFFNVDEAVGVPILDRTSEHIRNILERWLQRQICQSCKESLLLFDGSLTTMPVNNQISVMNELLRKAREGHNIVLAFSKQTTLSASGHRISDLIENKNAPCITNIDNNLVSQYGSHLNFLGRIYAAKLMPSYFTFRLDIDRKVPEAEGVQAVQKLLGNDLIVDGYPETLRLAHVLSRFSASEIIAMQRYVAENYNLKIICRPNVRQVLFGPYGGFTPTQQMEMNGYDAAL
jgi:hypothetical protein